jgi:hypothetical protein
MSPLGNGTGGRKPPRAAVPPVGSIRPVQVDTRRLAARDDCKGGRVERNFFVELVEKPTDTKTSRCFVIAADASAPPFPDGDQS